MTDTANRRRMAITIGMPFSVTVPAPNGLNDQTSRWHGAFCYFLGSEVPAVPSDGWIFGARSTVFQFSVSDVIFDSGRMRVWRMKRR